MPSRTFLAMLEPDLGEVDRLVELNKLAEHFGASTISLRDVVVRCLEKQRGTDRLLLFIDQWEELYTLCADEERDALSPRCWALYRMRR
jgi:hypothetical protein